MNIKGKGLQFSIGLLVETNHQTYLCSWRVSKSELPRLWWMWSTWKEVMDEKEMNAQEGGGLCVKLDF